MSVPAHAGGNLALLISWRSRARANGLITMENPVAQAVREGRFEELPDDADSD